MDEYSDISKDLTSDLDKSIKDGQGIIYLDINIKLY